MIREETSADLINRISNMAEVLPFLSYRGELDWQAAIDSPNCIILSNGDDAVGAFERTAPRAWQVHTIFGPTCRGRKAVDTGREMLAYMVPRHGDYVWGFTPLTNAKARWFNRQCGAKVIGQDCLPNDGVVEVFQYPSPEED